MFCHCYIVHTSSERKQWEFKRNCNPGQSVARANIFNSTQHAWNPDRVDAKNYCLSLILK